MVSGLAAFAVGLLLLRWIPILPPVWWLYLQLILGLLLLGSRAWRAGLFLLGLGWACLSAQWALDDRLERRLDGQVRWLEGRVVGLPSSADGVVRFELEDVHALRAHLPQRLRLSWHDGPPVLAGERWRLAVRLKRPRGLVNPATFDFEAWLLARRIGATGSVKAGERLLPASGPVAWRDQLRQRLLRVDAWDRAGGLAALVLGDGSGLQDRDWRLLQDTGTTHLMVISGQHITLFAGVLYGLVALLARLGLWPRRLPWLPWACAMAFIGGLGYGILAGFDVPVRRACVMLAVVLLWRLRFRHLGFLTPLLAALCVVLVAEPLVVLQPGFWLSFGAVALLVLAFAGRLGAWRWWMTWWRAQWVMGLGLAPLLLALALPISVSGPLANLVAVPWISLVVLPPALLGTAVLGIPWLGEALLWLAGGALELLFQMLAWTSTQLPAWIPVQLPVWAWLLGALGVLLLIAPAGVPLRALGLALLMPALFPPQQRLGPGQAEVRVLDVGQGLSVLVRTREHALLYDAGPRRGDFDIGDRVVVPTLRGLGVSRLDLMLISHADSDHAGGALAVRRGLTVGPVLSGEPERLAPDLEAEPCAAGAAWSWDGVDFLVWQPPPGGDSNDSSCVLAVEAAGERILLSGDLGVRGEAAWIASGQPLAARWLVAGHHGSRTSSSTAFLRAVKPERVLISRGHLNAYGHPHPLVASRIRALPADIHDTAEQGHLLLRLGTFGELEVEREKSVFWREK
ncbi:DNA internalization-related competence protein ComEC/Rec2 [Pseudomonas sp. JM0905a]|uniref:DNA internalization-related competence protein ComEC/Rec2 n=1 Tax=Metapseudomonas resinovorans TaxID=53412 RepID=A0ABT4Y2G4_METRE|nr:MULTISPECIES: DNA internalization-related competence protein ComEC/Rec2 [Pseudomonas]MBD2836590.1 DNA internalization-related competence protein ComEC/Rec2 [Pseudomonas sp. JM0905a]MDA8483030.1 DNA internalization-related competence protein ComEC/Rec2 [Pseudomonas resinovorans]